jgi:hypothetical protein
MLLKLESVLARVPIWFPTTLPNPVSPNPVLPNPVSPNLISPELDHRQDTSALKIFKKQFS